MGSPSDKASKQAAAMERDRQAKINQSVGSINQVFSNPDRQKQLDDFAAATRAFYTNDLNRQKGDVDRQSKFALARAGQTGGSLQRDTGTEIGENYNRGLVDAERLSQSAVSDLRQADEAAKNNLLAMAFSGLDSTTAAAQGNLSLQNNLLAGRSSQKANMLGDVFGNFADLYKRSREQADARRAALDFDTRYKSSFAPQSGFGT